VPGNPAENTTCPNCGKTLIRRSGYTVVENNIDGGRCRFCHAHIAGVWS
jgi:pyruvate formate lyase activating enzyme